MLIIITGPTLPAPEPGTGPHWAEAEGPGKPYPPKTTEVRAWKEIRGNQTPTDREHLLHLLCSDAEEGTARWANDQNEAQRLRSRAAAGFHDGSLPELGHFRPVYFDGVSRNA